MKNQNELQLKIIGTLHGNVNNWRLLEEVYLYHILFKDMRIKKSNTILLVGKVDHSWKAAYLAALITGVDFMIIPSGFTEREISWYANRYDAKLILLAASEKSLFVSQDAFRHIPFVDLVFNMWSKEFNKCRVHMANKVFGLLPIFNGRDLDLKYITLELTDHINSLNNSSKIYTLTSGVESAYPKVIVNTINTLWEAINAFILDFDDFEILMEHPERYHIFTVLYPLLNYKNTSPSLSLQGTKLNAMFDVAEFKSFWESIQLSVHLPRFLDYRIVKNYLIKRKIRKLFDKVIIINADIPYAWIKLLYKSCDLITTYGMEEANHIVTYNNYSNKTLRKRNCVGIPCNNDIEVHNNGAIVAPHLFHSYAQDKEASSLLKPRHDMVQTSDKISTKLVKDQPYIFLKDRMENIVDGIAYHDVEKEFLSYPYISNCIIANDPRSAKKGYILLIVPNYSYCEHKGLGLIGLKVLYRDLIGRLNIKTKKEFLTDVVVKDGDIMTTYDGKNKAFVYRYDKID